MKITAISDIHGNLINIEPCDLLLICGDISPLNMQRDYIQMTKWIFNEFQEWIMKIDCPTIILTPGNHDFWFQKMITQPTTYLFDKLTILIDGYTKIYNSKDDKWLTIFGTPWCRMCGNWAYVADGSILVDEHYSKIKENVDILICHDAPELGELGVSHFPDGIKVKYDNEVLATELLLKKPKYVFCGHVHSGDHELKEYAGIKAANVSILDEEYNIYYKPLTFTI